jgi:hypothetical protein
VTFHLDTTKRQLYELRFERVSPGISAAAILSWYAEAGSQGGGSSSWQSHHIPAPAGFWMVSVGGDVPIVLSLYRWDSLTIRERTLGSFLDSDEADHLTRRVFGDGGVGRSVESWILIDSPPAHTLCTDAMTSVSVHEMRVYAVLNGSMREASEALIELEIPAAIARGAHLTGIYELAIGPRRPTLVSMLTWPNALAPHEAWREIDGSEVVIARRRAEISRYRRRLFADTQQYLMSPLRFPAVLTEVIA